MKSTRTYLITLWNESDTYNYNDELENILYKFPNYAMIIHDKDKNIKIHTHICIYTEKTTLNYIFKQLPNIPKEHIEYCDKLKDTLLYLIHYNNEDKYHYNLYEVEGPLKQKLMQYIDTDREFNDMQLILTYIEQEHITNVKSLLPFIYQNCKWSSFRRNFVIINQVLTETRLNGKI